MNNSIRTKFLLTGLLICLTSLLLVSLASYYVSYTITEQQVNMHVQATAMKNAAELDVWFRKYSQIVEDLAAEIEPLEDYKQDGRLLKIIMAKTASYKPEAKCFYVLLADNTLFYPELNWVPPKGMDFRNRDWYVRAMKSTKEVYSKPYVDAHSGEMIITISRALKNDNSITGVVAVDIQLTNVTKVVNEYNLGEGSYAFLLDQEANILTHPDKNFLPNKTTGLVTIDSLKELVRVKEVNNSKQSHELISEQREIKGIKDYDGKSRIFITSKINSCDWVLGIAIPKSSYQKPLNSLFYGYAVALMISLLVALGIMISLINGMTTPIKQLNDSVKSFSAANMAVRVEVASGDEIGELGRSFNHMADTIQEYSQSLEEKVAERTKELQEKNDNIMESIDYAERLQRSILPPLPHRLGISAEKCFVIWKPKDVVGGDMYWCRGDERFVLVAVVDCTGHGVPGALMTMALGSILDGMPRMLDDQKPAALLHSIHNSLKETLRQENKDSLANDGADIALCLLDKLEKRFLFAGAKLSLFVEKDGEVTEYKGVKHSVGYSHRKDVVFEDREIDWIDGSVVYMTTDGLLDQNGEEGKGGVGRSGFVKLLQSIAGKSFSEQERVVDQLIVERLKNVEQRDDITVVGFEINGNIKNTETPRDI